jgi:hypothetical protein
MKRLSPEALYGVSASDFYHTADEDLGDVFAGAAARAVAIDPDLHKTRALLRKMQSDTQSR